MNVSAGWDIHPDVPGTNSLLIGCDATLVTPMKFGD